MGSPRIKGNALRLTLGGVDYWADLTACTISQGDVASFRGDHEWEMGITAIQSTKPGSLWRLLWASAGFDGWTDYAYAPHGNDTPTDEKPHFVGRLKLPDVSAIGGEAGEDTEYVFSITVSLDGRPRMITDPSQL